MMTHYQFAKIVFYHSLILVCYTLGNLHISAKNPIFVDAPENWCCCGPRRRNKLGYVVEKGQLEGHKLP